jgi:hypothetical protein
MAPANPLRLQSRDLESGEASPEGRREPEAADAPAAAGPEPEPVSQQELNAWRRGFTPQAEIWNGRLAMLGLSVGLTVLLVARIAAGFGSS